MAFETRKKPQIVIGSKMKNLRTGTGNLEQVVLFELLEHAALDFDELIR